VYKDHHNCTYVFLRQDATHHTLEPPYSSRYQVLSWNEKTLQLLVRGKPLTVSTNRIKPAYIFNETDITAATGSLFITDRTSQEIAGS
jgi:hypothetical protein